MRLGVYTDYVYRRIDGVIYAERAFALFLAGLREHVEQLSLIGRLARDTEQAHYALPPGIELAPLQYYGSLANPVVVLKALVASLHGMWTALDEIDVAWILGPYPHAIVLVILALARRRTVVLGVRQDWPRYVRMRRPQRRWMHWAADALELVWHAFARRLPVVAVGAELTAKYAHAPSVLDLAVSLVPASVVQREAALTPRDYDDELRVVSVGRLEQEKNPLLLAEVIALLRARDPRWRLLVCGEGDLSTALADRLTSLGVAEHADLFGYVPMGDTLLSIYRESHAMLHVSWTEGFPQVLIEAFATALPVVATAVGGVPAGVGDAALLIRPGDPRAAAEALLRIASEPDLRDRLTRAGVRRAGGLTLEAQTERLAAFLHAQENRAARSARTRS